MLVCALRVLLFSLKTLQCFLLLYFQITFLIFCSLCLVLAVSSRNPNSAVFQVRVYIFTLWEVTWGTEVLSYVCLLGQALPQGPALVRASIAVVNTMPKSNLGEKGYCHSQLSDQASSLREVTGSSWFKNQSGHAPLWRRGCWALSQTWLISEAETPQTALPACCPPGSLKS